MNLELIKTLRQHIDNPALGILSQLEDQILIYKDTTSDLIAMLANRLQHARQFVPAPDKTGEFRQDDVDQVLRDVDHWFMLPPHIHETMGTIRGQAATSARQEFVQTVYELSHHYLQEHPDADDAVAIYTAYFQAREHFGMQPVKLIPRKPAQ